MKAFGLDFNLYDLLVCINFEDQALEGLYISYLAIEKAMHDTKTDDMIGDILGSLLGIYGGYQQFKQGLPWCENAFGKRQDVNPVIEAMDFVADPFENIPTMAFNLVKYEDELKEDIMSADFYFKTEQYDKFGEFLGNVVKVVAKKEAEFAAEENNLFLY